MLGKLDLIITNINKNPGADDDAIRVLTENAWVKIPDEYLQMLRCFDGAEGFVGASYLALWPAREIIDANNGYRIREFLPGVLLFGSSMGGTGYGFCARGDEIVIVEVPFDSMTMRDVVVRAKGIEEFLLSLKNQ